MPGRQFVAGHLSRASLELLEVLGLDVKRSQCLLEHLGVIFEALEAFLESPGVLLRPFWSLLGRSWRPLVFPAPSTGLGGFWAKLLSTPLYST